MKMATTDDPLKLKFVGVNRKALIRRINRELSSTEEGRNLVREEASKLYSIFESKISELRGEEVPLPVERTSSETDEFITVYGPETSQGRLSLRLRFGNNENFRVKGAELQSFIGYQNGPTSTRGACRNPYIPYFNESRHVLWRLNNLYSSEQIVNDALIEFADGLAACV
jgi:hypothetical protein